MKKQIKIALCTAGTVFLCAIIVFAGIKTKYKLDEKHFYAANTNTNPVLLVAHRGYSDAAPENTLASFIEAGKSGKFYGAECDVQQTSDGVWVIMHDDDVKRTTDGEGNVSDFTYEQLSLLNIDSGSGIDKYPNEKIPTLEEYLDVCRQYSMRPFIEIKSTATPEQAADIYSVLCKHSYEKECTVISFNLGVLESLRALDSDLDIYYLSTFITEKDISACIKNNFGLDFNQAKEHNTAKVLNKVYDNGISLAAWTVKTQQQYNRMIDNGINIITCNSPDFN